MRKNDTITWTALLRFERIDLRQDEKGNTYALLKSKRGTRVLCWESSVFAPIKEIIDAAEEHPHAPVWECKGYVNQLLGNSFLCLQTAEKKIWLEE